MTREGEDFKIRHVGRRAFKEEVLAMLRSDDPERALEILIKKPPMPIINTLFSLLLSHEPLIRWRAITAMGRAVARLAQEDLESARVVLRRMIWQLNDESGGIGWGCPEAMGESLARDHRLAAEYAHILISYVREDANFLEYEPLRAGAVWAIGRVAQERPECVKDAISHLLPSLGAQEPALRGMAVWALGHLRATEAISSLIILQDDSTEVEIYEDHRLRQCLIKDLVGEVLARIHNSSLRTGQFIEPSKKYS
jgi:HEAT repeat protein